MGELKYTNLILSNGEKEIRRCIWHNCHYVTEHSKDGHKDIIQWQCDLKKKAQHSESCYKKCSDYESAW